MILISVSTYTIMITAFGDEFTEVNYTFLNTVIVCSIVGIISGYVFLRSKRKYLENELRKLEELFKDEIKNDSN